MKKLLLQNKVLAVVIHTVALITTLIFAVVLYVDPEFRLQSFKIFIFAIILFLVSLSVYNKNKENFQIWGKEGAPFLFFWTKYPLANLNLSIATSVLAVRMFDPIVASMMGNVTSVYLNFLDMTAYPQLYPILAAMAVTVLVLTTTQTSLVGSNDVPTKIMLGLIWLASIMIILATVITIKNVPVIEKTTLDEWGVLFNLVFQYMLQVLWLKELLYRTSAVIVTGKKK